MRDYGALIEVGVGSDEIPYPYVFERGIELSREGVNAAELARFWEEAEQELLRSE